MKETRLLLIDDDDMFLQTMSDILGIEDMISPLLQKRRILHHLLQPCSWILFSWITV
jgi:hypothetical protein